MKRFLSIFIVFAVFFTGVCSCERKSGDEPSASVEKAIVHLSLGVAETKTSTTDPFHCDNLINRALIFIFEPSAGDPSVPGQIVGIVENNSANGALEYDIETTIGPKFFYVVLNSNGSVYAVGDSYSDIKSEVFSMTGDCEMFYHAGNVLYRDDGPLMTGLSAKTNITSSDQDVAVTVTRRVFRVNVASIVNMLPANYSVAVQYVYLSDYVESYTFGNSNAGTIVYGNSRGRNSGVINGTSVYSDNSYASISLGAVIPYQSVTTAYAGKGMYAFPNPCVTDTWGASNAAARKTKVVVVANLSGRVYYYPIPLPPIACNNTLDLSVTLNNIGTTDPALELEKGTANLTFTVSDWSSTNRNFTF